MKCISFTCDYNEGAHPRILERLSQTNLDQEPGYGDDSFCAAARNKIREAVNCKDADVFFLVGGTQTNATVIDAMLRSYEGVIAAHTGHIAVHESGAIEAGGHKVITLPGKHGKLDAGSIRAYMDAFLADEAKDHMVQPGMIYISFPTEYGTLYSASELYEIKAVSEHYSLPVFIDGARLGYGLASPECDLTLPTLAQLCDVFYIGGTKVGALCGEAVVFPKGDAPAHFFTTIKQHGALLAKGRLLGIQFDTLFTDGLYMQISRNAIERAMELRQLFIDKGIPMLLDSPTNQQFPVMSREQLKPLEGKVRYEIWEQLPDGRLVTRFATSWATTGEQIRMLAELL
ncbi:MAG: amino acid lyase [Bacteroidales bacterium]|nr:amino acid lyase [Bacteroidales bacterium]